MCIRLMAELLAGGDGRFRGGSRWMMGTTWKRSQPVDVGGPTSFILANGMNAPGHVHSVVHQVFGDSILVAWVSKFCEGGTPLFSLITESVDDPFLLKLPWQTWKTAMIWMRCDLYGSVWGGRTTGIGDGLPTNAGFSGGGGDPLFVRVDGAGEAGCRETTLGSPQRVIENDACALGQTGAIDLGTRDANLPVVDCAAGWRADMAGRPGRAATGYGHGAGGGLVRGDRETQQTDIWYSHISQADFDRVFQPGSRCWGRSQHGGL